MFLIKLICWLLPSITIKIDGEKYLTRYYVLLRDWKWFNIYIHHFHMGDPEQVLHSHPWRWALSFILYGGYIEEYKLPGFDVVHEHIVFPFSFNKVSNNIFHRVDLLKEEGAWSLFFAGPRNTVPPEWGFWDRDTKIFKDWRESPNAIP